MNKTHPLRSHFSSATGVLLILPLFGVLIAGWPAWGANNTFSGAGTTSWNNSANWSTNATPASTDALLINSASLASGTLETVDNSVAVQSLSFDTGANNLTIDTNATGVTGRTLTLSGGTDALGNADSIDLSPTTTGNINLGLASGTNGTMTVSLGTTNPINVSNAAAKLTIGAVISGGSGLSKSGAGTLTLTGANIYTGNTTVTSGTLEFSGGSLAAGSNFIVGSGASSVGTAIMDGSVGVLHFSGSDPSGIVIGNNGGTGTLTVGAGTLSNASGDITVGLGTSSTGTLIVAGGAVTSNRLILADGASNSDTFTINSGSLTTGVFFLGGGAGTGTSTATVNLNGGTTTVTSIQRFSAVPSVVNFNGGTISPGPSATTSNFLQAGITYNVLAGGAIFNSGTFNLTVSQPLVHSGGGTDGGLVKNGSGSLILSSSNNYNGGTVINSGTIQMGNTFGLGATTGNLAINAGTLDLNGNSPSLGALSGSSGALITSSAAGTLTVTSSSASSSTYAGTIANGSASSVSLTKAGTGTLTLSGANTYTGNTTITSGTLEFSGGSLAAGTNLSVGNGAGSVGSMIMDGSVGTLHFSGSDPSGIVVGNSSATGTLTVNAGTLAAGTGDLTVGLGTSGSGTVIVGGGAITSTRVILTEGANTSATLTINSGSLTTGLFIFGGGNESGTSFATLNLNGGTLTVSDLQTFHTPTAVVNFNGGTIVPAASTANFMTSGITYNILGGGVVINTGTFNITVGQSLVHGGSGTDGGLTKNGSGTLGLAAASSYNGGTIINSGTIQLGNASSLGTGGLAINAGTLDLNAISPSFGALSGSSGGLITSSVAGTLTVTSSSASSSTFAGTIANGTANSIGLTKAGASTLTLTGANTYTGSTTVTSGTLEFSGGSLAAGGNLIVGNGAGSVGSTIMDGSVGTLHFSNSDPNGIVVGNSGGTGTLAVNAGTLSNASGDVTIALGNNSTDTLTVGGGAVVSNRLILADGTNDLSTVTINSGSFSTGLLFMGGGNGNASSTTIINLNGGTLTVNSIARDSAVIATVNFNGGTISPTANSGSFLGTGITFNVLSGGVNFNTSGFNITVPVALVNGGGTDGGLIKSGSGMLTLSSANTYNGGTIINSGTLQLGNASGLGAATGNLAINAGTLDINGLSPSVGALSGSSGGLITSSAGGTLTLTSSSAGSSTYAGTIANGSAGSVSLLKAGSGTLTMTGANTYTGNLTVTGGTAEFSGGSLAAGGNLFVGNGTGATGSMIMDGSAGTIHFAGSDPNGIVAGNAGGAGAITVNAGTLTDAVGDITLGLGANSAGTFTVGGGTVVSNRVIIDDGASTSGTFTINSGSVTTGLFIFGGSAVSGTSTATLNLNGGTLTATDLQPSTHPTSIVNFNGGTISPAASTSNFLQSGITYNVLAGGAIFNTGTFNATVSSALVNGNGGTDGGLIKSGSGTLTLSASNTFNGNIAVNGGVLATSGGNTTSSVLGANTAGRTVTINAGAMLQIGTTTLWGNTSASPANVSLVVNSGTAETVNSFTRLGNVTLNGGTLTDAGGFGGGFLSFDFGLLTSGSNGTVGVIGSSPSYINQNGGTNNGVQLGPNTIFAVSDVTGDAGADLIVTANLSNQTPSQGSAAGGFTKSGAGTMLISGSQSYTGVTTISAGTLQLGDGASNNGSITGNITNNASLVFANPTAQSYTGIISGSGAVTAAGPGTLTVTKNNTYTGPTTVTSGTFVVASTGALLGTGTTSVMTGATLLVHGSISGSQINVLGGTLAGEGTLAANVAVGSGSGTASSSVIDPSAAGGALGTQLYIQGNLRLNSDAAYQFKLNSDESGITDQLLVTGTLTLSGSPMLTAFDLGSGVSADIGSSYPIAFAGNIVGTFGNAPISGSTVVFGSDTYTITYQSTEIDLTLTAVPEPGTWATVIIGFGMLVGLQASRRRHLLK